jgi:nucleoside-diphosphate-sugar epimerase
MCMKLWYALAKISAEKAAWEFAKENNIDLVTVLPSFVIGPSLSHELSVTASDILGLLQGISCFFWNHYLSLKGCCKYRPFTLLFYCFSSNFNLS